MHARRGGGGGRAASALTGRPGRQSAAAIGEPSEPLPRAIDDVGLLDRDEIAAELGLGDGDGLGGFGAAFESDIASLEDIGAGGTDPGFAEELADLDVPTEDDEES